jgi:D-amino-acid dehydrogenase
MEGHKVTVVDQSNLDAGASYVNAGYLSPSHIIPLAAPGVMKQGLKWMLDPSSPLYIKPRFDLDFLKWAWAFNKSCNKEHVNRSIPVIKDISVLSQDLYEDIGRRDQFNFHYEKKGLFMFCQTEAMLEEEIRVVKLANEIGLEAREVGLDELKQREPDVRTNVIGATIYNCDAHTTPGEFMRDMKAHLIHSGVTFYKNEKVLDIEVEDRRIKSAITDRQTLIADEFVLAAGSWSPQLSQKLGLKLLLQAGKGYRMNVERATGISYPTILAEAKVAVTPMHGFTRFSGTMEIAGIDHGINRVRVDAIARAAHSYYPDVNISKEEKAKAASGLRPVSPDGLPYIGKSEKCDNLTFATGHAMMGLSMATGTGKLVSEIISEQAPSMDLKAFHPDRKF